MDYRTYVLWGAALLLALITFLVSRKWDFTPRSSAAGRLVRHASNDHRDMTDKIGDVLVDRLGLSLASWKHELRWAQIGGYYQKKIDEKNTEYKTVGSVLGQSVLFAAVGLAYIVLFHAYSPLYFGVVGILAYYPFLTLRSKGDSVRDLVKRTLPETAALISAEMSAGGSLEKAVQRAKELPGPLGFLLKEADEKARTSGLLLFSQGQVQGILVQRFAELKFSPLETFANRMDNISSKGKDGPKRMSDLAGDLATEYQVVVARAAETLDSKLLMPMTIFFFVPFMAAVFIPLMVNLFEVF